jgi:N-acetylglucosaminyl-diphospho-decaprenol L-rhamnosyltransferase
MARSAVWRELGGFDTGFFMWYEDVDLARRCLQTGRRNVVVGNARAQHQGAAAFMQLDARARQHLRLESLERYGRKHHPRIGLALRVSVGAARRLRAGRRGSRAAERLRT